MKSTDTQATAAKIISAILAALDEEAIEVRIDQPLIEALGQFHVPEVVPFTAASFHRAIGLVVSHVYAHGLGLKQSLSPGQAVAEALSILDRSYQGASGRGYDAAFLDASQQPPGGMDGVLNSIVWSILETERAKYIQWVFDSRLSGADWPLRCEIAELILNQSADLLTPVLRRCSPAQLADAIPALLRELCGVEAFVHRHLVSFSRGQLKQAALECRS